MSDKFPPLAEDPWRYLMEVYGHDGHLVDICIPSLPPDHNGFNGPLFHAFSWARDYLHDNPAAARIRISSLRQVCWVGGCENG